VTSDLSPGSFLLAVRLPPPITSIGEGENNLAMNKYFLENIRLFLSLNTYKNRSE
jgi:hypothetical protein